MWFIDDLKGPAVAKVVQIAEVTITLWGLQKSSMSNSYLNVVVFFSLMKKTNIIPSAKWHLTGSPKDIKITQTLLVKHI